MTEREDKPTAEEELHLVVRKLRDQIEVLRYHLDSSERERHRALQVVSDYQAELSAIRDREETARRDGITLNAKQLREAVYWANPDNDPEQDETEVRIEWMPERTSADGERMAPGDYLYFIDCPEEGVLGPIDGEGFDSPTVADGDAK